MVRKINQMRLIEDELSRQLSFAKRRNGLIKKALELHLVCGVDAIFVAFSPSGRLSYFCGDNRVEDVLSRFVALPENIRRFHIPDLEVLRDIIGQLKDQTQEHIKHDRTILAIQKEHSQVEEEISRLLFDIRIYEPMEKAIMTIEEANQFEETLEKTLAEVQERKKELTAKIHNEEASQPSDSMIIHKFAAENSSPKPLDEVLQAEFQHQPKQDYDKNQAYSPTADQGIQITLMEGSSSRNLLVDMAASPHPQHAGTSFSSLLTAADVAETLSPIRESVYSQSPEQNNNSSYQQNQSSFFQDGLLETHSYPNGMTGVYQSSECNEISTYRTENGYNNFPGSNISPNIELPSSPASFEVPHHQIQFPMQLQTPYYQMPVTQMPLGSNSNVSVFSSPQWSNQRTLQQNPAPFGQRTGFLNLLNTVSGLNNMYSDSRSPALSSIPSNLLMNFQSMGGRSYMGPTFSLNLQEPFANYTPQAHLEVEGSPYPAQKRKFPWEDDIILGLSSYQNGSSSSNNAILPAPSHSRPTGNAVYNTAYEMMGRPIDPHCRIFEEVLQKDDGNQQHENR